MTTWYSWHGWGWCGVMVNIPVMVLLWGALVAAIILALRSAARRPSDPPARAGTRYSRSDGVAAARTPPPKRTTTSSTVA